jgi:hypothetical protein
MVAKVANARDIYRLVGDMTHMIEKFPVCKISLSDFPSPQ